MIPMKLTEKIQLRLQGLIDAVSRFPLTTVFLIGAVLVRGYMIQANNQQEQIILLMSCIVGAFLASVAQVAHEGFFPSLKARLAGMGASVVLAGAYYFLLSPAPRLTMEIGIRTSVVMFALGIAFVLVPVIRSRFTFNESFLITFKSFFIALFFAGVIMAGISLSIGAVNQLLFSVNYRAYSHTANLIFTIFAPLYFLSMIPHYGREEARVEEEARYPRILEILISYIIIPLSGIFTLILVAYILLNVRGEFWTNNLLEPMLVSYAIAIILIYFLASRLENRFAQFYRKVFPKILVPIVIFQLISSFMTLRDAGITHGRYYVILFGIFAATAGILFSVLPVRRNGIVAGILIAFALFSIVPPLDAFTVSRKSQTRVLENVLTRNNMLEGGTIRPDGTIPNEEKQRIITAMNYMNMMDYTKTLPWLPADFEYYRDFFTVFGFREFEQPGGLRESIFLYLEPGTVIPVGEYDFLLQRGFYYRNEERNEKIADILVEGVSYSLWEEVERDGRFTLSLRNTDGQQLLSFPSEEIFSNFFNFYSVNKNITLEQATFTKENESAGMTLVMQEVIIDKMASTTNYNASASILIRFR